MSKSLVKAVQRAKIVKGNTCVWCGVEKLIIQPNLKCLELKSLMWQFLSKQQHLFYLSTINEFMLISCIVYAVIAKSARLSNIFVT